MNEVASSPNSSTAKETTATEAPSKELSDLATRVAALEHRPEKADFQSWTAVATLSALAIYGAARFGDTAFYARLGTDADTVGLNYGVTLARVATTVVVAGAGAVALFFFGRYLAKPQDEKTHQGLWAKLFFFLAVTLACILSYLLLVLIIPPILVPVEKVRVFVALAGTVALCLAGYRYEKARSKKNAFDPIRSVIAFAIAIVLLFGLAAIVGYQSAGHIMRGQQLPCPCISALGRNITLPWSSGTNGFLGIKAEAANITWIGPGASPVPEFAIFLGGSNDSVVLFDIGTQNTIIVPNTDVIVSPVSDLTGWDER
jgi:hypothetical protein